MKSYKICILGNTGNNPFSAYSWFIKTVSDGAWHLGHEVIGFDYKSHSITEIRDFLFNNDIDILFTHLTMHQFHDKFSMMEIFDNLRSLKGTIVIHTMQDARHEPRYKGDISSAFDLALVGQTENIEKFQKTWKVPVYYWPYSALTYSKMADFKEDLAFKVPVFPGNPDIHKDRSAFIRKLRSTMNIKIIKTGSKEDVRNRTGELSVSAKCILGLCTGYDIEGYCEVRPWQYLGAGACMIMRKFKGIDDIIPEDLYYPIDGYTWNDAKKVSELFEKIKKTNNMPLKERAFNFIQRYHSSKERMKQTLEIIEGKRSRLSVYLSDLQ